MARAFRPIRKRGNGWIVVDREGHTLGSHRTYQDALTQLRAIEYRTHGAAFHNPRTEERRFHVGDWAELDGEDVHVVEVYITTTGRPSCEVETRDGESVLVWEDELDEQE